tara:strand:+ start:1136 stop:3124 length:1989 start_codon:yes stop_codon:yes gene_type:complete
MIVDNKDNNQNPPQEEIKNILNLFNSKKFVETKKEIDKQLLIYPNSSILFNILGAVQADQNELDKAVDNYKKSIKINPNYAQAYNNLGIALHKLDKMDEAIENYQKALSIKPDFVEALNNLGNAMREINNIEDSLQYFKKAIQLKPNYAEAHCSLGGAYQDLKNNEEAMNYFKQATKIKPDYSEAHLNLGILYTDLNRYEEALKSYDKAIKLKPDYEKAYNNLGNLLSTLGRYNEAASAYRQAIKIKTDYSKAYSNLLFNLNYELNLDPNVYLQEAKNFGINCRSAEIKQITSYNFQKKPSKLKLGFVTSDFGNHPGGYFTLSTLRELQKKNFELIAYSNYDRVDEYAHHFKPLFKKWHSIKRKKDKEVVQKILEDGIHILIEMQGHSSKNRVSLFMCKPAPVQVSWLSQGTLGISEIDYLIGSSIIIPKNEENHFIEKIIRLPDITQCFTPPDFDVKINTLPATKNGFITFGSLNKLTKVNDDVISLWSQVLLAVPNSKLILKSIEFNNQEIIDNTIRRFKKCNIDKKHLILQGKSKTRKEVFEVYNKIDIGLDPFPFQGNTSTCEAVWMGVPVLTLKGNRLLFHFGESINKNLEMSDWIAKNQTEYVLKATKFSSNLKKLSEIRATLRNKAINSPVFDAKRFSSNISDLFWKIWNDFENK